jgi:hypothetical protein
MPDALICYQGSIEKLKLLGATYLLTFPPFFAFIDSCYGPMGGAVGWLIVWGVTAP